MDSNREKEVLKKLNHYELWNLSKKYTEILVNHIKENSELQYLSENICKQFYSELTSRNFYLPKNHTIFHCWNTMIRTIQKHPCKRSLHKQSIQLLHQTSVQRSYQQ